MSMQDIFGEVISSYSREEALADGVLVDVSEMAKEAGIKFPVAMTSKLYHEIIVPDPRAVEGMGQSVEGRLWDALSMLRFAIKGGQGGSDVRYQCYFIMKAKQKRLIELKALCHPGDDMEPVITIMLPEED